MSARESWLGWGALALAVFWFVGAYNRMMRLRSAALQAYSTLDGALTRQLEFVLAHASQREAEAAASRSVVSVQAAAAQLQILLAATRPRPLEPARIAALSTALHALLGAWQGLYPNEGISFDADGTLSRPASLEAQKDRPDASEPPPIAWPEPSAAAEIARRQFNQAVMQYNAAIGQLPAQLVAWIMQLRRAACLT
ncbi:MAG: lema family protein [Gammaproteobacteria bacterium]|nr:lema family protein [Gammaproteobacteria bacterium]MBU2407050.1 lema family protein [Gammaproteobacteria bacterium]